MIRILVQYYSKRAEQKSVAHDLAAFRGLSRNCEHNVATFIYTQAVEATSYNFRSFYVSRDVRL